MAVVRAHSPNPAHPGDRFGDYLLLGRIASGGMAEIHLACALEGEIAGKPVALKRMLPHLAQERRFVDMFLGEANIASRVRHDNVCSIYDYGEVDGEYFIAMEYLHGGSLGSLLTKLSRRRRRLKMRFIAAIIADVCAGLQAAHELGVIHRDVSPNNIFITVDGDVKLLDFGVAKASFASSNTRTGVVKGTFAYMSPEQLRGRPLDPRSDVFSLGVVLHEAITCRRLFKRENDYATCRAITTETIPRACDLRASTPLAVSNAIDRALARRRQDRYASVTELGSAVATALAAAGEPPDREAIGREIARLFADELERIDDIVASQPTRVALARQIHRAPTAPRQGFARRHDAGDVISVLPLRADRDDQLDEAHPSERFEAIDPTLEASAETPAETEESEDATSRSVPCAAPRSRSRTNPHRLHLAAIAVAVLVLGAGSRWSAAPAGQGLARPAPAPQPPAQFIGVGEAGVIVDDLVVRDAGDARASAPEPAVPVEPAVAAEPAPAAEPPPVVDPEDEYDHPPAPESEPEDPPARRAPRKRVRRARRPAPDAAGPGERLLEQL